MHKQGRKGQGGSRQRGSGGQPGGSYWIYGLHAVEAALANPLRELRRIVASANRRDWMEQRLKRPALPHPEWVDGKELARLTGEEAVHQGVAALVNPLADIDLMDVSGDGGAVCLVMLDQVTDPHNIGAVLRSCAAFGVAGVILPKDNSPPETAVMAKAACGALETVPLIRVTNLSRSLAELQEDGFWCIGLDGEAKAELQNETLPKKLVFVFGSEGKGLRRLVGETCDQLARLPILPAMESLNVSNAVAISLYEMHRQRMAL